MLSIPIQLPLETLSYWIFLSNKLRQKSLVAHIISCLRLLPIISKRLEFYGKNDSFIGKNDSMMADMRVMHQNLESDFILTLILVEDTADLSAVALDFKHEINVKQAENTI